MILRAPDGVGVDHADRDGLNNQRENLRLVNQRENLANSHKPRTRNGQPTSSRYKGVSRSRGQWEATIKHRGRSYHLGRFNFEEDAARARDYAAELLHGEFATSNDLPGSGSDGLLDS
jgi:hypothetical protein